MLVRIDHITVVLPAAGPKVYRSAELVDCGRSELEAEGSRLQRITGAPAQSSSRRARRAQGKDKARD
ncbi:hypothetical protein PsYK624_011440 [Phanerochaete sordida]|uniref:Uncharacterized protein n=1 Tax=Phanerochaete sordida TaxID=48140 RepID=A0A9P3FYX0_9APHY|nr:hypothetical protein PsYK624_011440 [Phanerochaete sordida]